jgi:hypothetical protein
MIDAWTPIAKVFHLTAETPFIYLTHNLGTEDIIVQVWRRESPDGQTEPVIKWVLVTTVVGIIDENQIAVEFTTSLLSNWPSHEYKIVINAVQATSA